MLTHVMCVYPEEESGGWGGLNIFNQKNISERRSSVLCLKILSGRFSEHGRTKQKTAIKYSISGREKMKSEFVHAAKSHEVQSLFLF